MAKKEEYKPKSVDVFDVRKGVYKTGPRAGEPFRRITFAKGVTIQFNGYELDLGEWRGVNLKDSKDLQDQLEYLVKNEYITQEEKEKREAFNEEKEVVGKVNLPLK